MNNRWSGEHTRDDRNRGGAPARELRGMSDAALLDAALLRDERAWRELARRYRPLVYRCAARVLRRHDPAGSVEDLNEVCGEVWYSLLRDDMHKLRAYDPARGARLSSWLGMLAVNAACDFLRQRARRPPLLYLCPRDDRQGDAAREVPAPEPSALDELLRKERYRIVSALLAGFSRRDRDFVALYFESGLSAEEVAAQMGISVKTVYSKKNKVRVRLASLLRRRGDDSEAALAA